MLERKLISRVMNRHRMMRWCALMTLFALGGCNSYLSKEAEVRFKDVSGPFTVTVYPVQVVLGDRIEYDVDLARKLTTALKEENLAQPVIDETPPVVPVVWHHNEAKMAQESAQAFGAWVKGQADKGAGIQTQYALLGQILSNPGETGVIGVHFYLSESSGQLANGGLTNSHWEEFQEVHPKNRVGGYEVLLRMLSKQWKRG